MSIQEGGWHLRWPPAGSALRSFTATSGKKQAAKSKEELAQEKKKELEKRLQDVSGQLNNNKKPAKKGTCLWATLLPLLRSSGQRGGSAGGEWPADPGFSLWLDQLWSRVPLDDTIDLLKPQVPCL